jgi:hypothetical protein
VGKEKLARLGKASFSMYQTGEETKSVTPQLILYSFELHLIILYINYVVEIMGWESQFLLNINALFSLEIYI